MLTNACTVPLTQITLVALSYITSSIDVTYLRSSTMGLNEKIKKHRLHTSVFFYLHYLEEIDISLLVLLRKEVIVHRAIT